MKLKFLFTINLILIGTIVNAQFTFENNQATTNNEIVAPVMLLSNELRIANTFTANDPVIGTLDNTGYGINVHTTEGIGFALNNNHIYRFKPTGEMIVSTSNPVLRIEGTGTGSYQGANLILSAKGVTSGNSHAATWLMTHRGTDGTAAIEFQRRGLSNEYNGTLLKYSDGLGWRFLVANTTTSGLTNAMTIDNFGKIGVGTTTPDAKLDIYGANSSTNNLILSANYEDKFRWRFNTHDRGNAIDLDITASDNTDTQEPVLKLSRSNSGRPEFQLYDNTLVANNTNIGIGTNNPSEKLDVIGTTRSKKLLIDDPNDVSDWNNLWQSGFYQSFNGTNVPESNQWFWGINMNHSSNNPDYRYNGQLVIKNHSTSPKMYFRSTNKDGVGTWARVLHSVGNQHIDGALGIGTSTPDAELTVKGKIHAEEVKIDLSVPAPDYVFTKDYDLLSIEEVQQHITEKGHLPNIPSAKELEANGVELGIMNMKLLEKIEELTLYTIQQQKEIEELKKEMKSLKSK